MPAEKTYGMQHRLDIPGAGKEVPPQVPIVDVRWGRDQGYVQVVTKAEDPFGGRFGGDDDLTIVVTDGFYVDLDRNAINTLIRNLRRARDQAFGRDE